MRDRGAPIAVWLGYDNASGKRRTLGGGATGGGGAVPIFEPIIQAVWANVAPKTALAPPSPEAKRHLTCERCAGGDIKRKHRAGSHVISGRFPFRRRTEGGAGR